MLPPPQRPLAAVRGTTQTRIGRTADAGRRCRWLSFGQLTQSYCPKRETHLSRPFEGLYVTPKGADGLASGILGTSERERAFYTIQTVRPKAREVNSLTPRPVLLLFVTTFGMI